MIIPSHTASTVYFQLRFFISRTVLYLSWQSLHTAGSTQLLHILPPEFLAGGMEAIVRRLGDPDQRRRWPAASKAATAST